MQRGRSEPGKVGLLWREMAIYVAENGVWRWGGGLGRAREGLFSFPDIFVAPQAREQPSAEN